MGHIQKYMFFYLVNATLLFAFSSCGKAKEQTTYYSNGAESEQFSQYQNEDGSFVKHGTYRKWSPDGQLLILCNYQDGIFHGEYREWYDDGRPYIETNYEHGKLEGKYREWHLFSAHVSKEFEFKQDMKNGKCIEFWANGNKKTEETYILGLINDVSHSWFENGNLESIYTYKAGIKNGAALVLQSSGDTIVCGHYIGESFSGRRYYYYVDDKKEHMESYEKGSLNGDTKYWYPDGTYTGAITYKDGHIIDFATMLYGQWKQGLTYTDLPTTGQSYRFTFSSDSAWKREIISDELWRAQNRVIKTETGRWTLNGDTVTAWTGEKRVFYWKVELINQESVYVIDAGYAKDVPGIRIREKSLTK